MFVIALFFLGKRYNDDQLLDFFNKKYKEESPHNKKINGIAIVIYMILCFRSLFFMDFLSTIIICQYNQPKSKAIWINSPIVLE
jgi:hypothetical protein